ncbi:DNA-directed RNA polymerase specialized sigma24 family protein [Nocardioides sp. HB32]
MTSVEKTTQERQAVRCDDVARYGGSALDGSLPLRGAAEIGEHLVSCDACTNYIDQVAKTVALVALRGHANDGHEGVGDRGEDPGSDAELARTQSCLMSLARAIDPSHADELVQGAWDHLLTDQPSTARDRGQLVSFLLRRAREHVRADDARDQAWAADLVRHHPHNAADLAETEHPDPGSHEDWRALADLDVLDPDGDRAELYLPDLYGDGPDQGEWSAPPSAWPSVTNILGPEAEAETAELYSVLDAALDELTGAAADAVYLVDIEGHSLETASSLLGRSIGDLQRDLLESRDQVRRRISSYLAAG